MRPALRPRPSLTLYRARILVAGWTIYGLFSAWQEHSWLATSMHPPTWGESLRYEMGYALLWGLSTPLILWLADRYRIERNHRVKHLLVHAAAMTFLIVVNKTLFDLILNPPGSSFYHFTWAKLFRSVLITADTGALLYVVVVLVEHAYVYYRRYQQSIVNAGQLQTQLARAQLQALRMQLHPHFLFNTLNTIAALVHEDPELADQTIARLSELLRLFLAGSTIHEVTLGEELRVLDLYLEIERTRFEDRMKVYIDVPDDLRDIIVPSLVLQPLVENAIRHGIGRKTGPGWLSISAEQYGGTLVLRVMDNGAGLGTGAGEGMGLSITRGRLESLYGAHQSLVLRDVPSGGVEARISMPCRRPQRPDTSEDSVNEETSDAVQSADR